MTHNLFLKNVWSVVFHVGEEPEDYHMGQRSHRGDRWIRKTSNAASGNFEKNMPCE